ncbi:MAG: hypothetical protein MN733_38055 [Nitrososphaera sp.]|nr:hypothetical protein [Nitrososphaera sp.]
MATRLPLEQELRVRVLHSDQSTERKLVLNTDLIHAVADAVDSKPQTYQQDNWATQKACGTAYCYGGWAMVLSGWELDPTFFSWFKEGEEEVVCFNDTGLKAVELLGIEVEWPYKTPLIFSGHFKPHSHLTPGEAFRKHCEGTPLEEVGTVELQLREWGGPFESH